MFIPIALVLYLIARCPPHFQTLSYISLSSGPLAAFGNYVDSEFPGLQTNVSAEDMYSPNTVSFPSIYLQIFLSPSPASRTLLFWVMMCQHPWTTTNVPLDVESGGGWLFREGQEGILEPCTFHSALL